MRLARRATAGPPVVKPLGESIYELIGAPDALGGTTGHSLAEILIPPGGSSAAHHHRRAEETYYILRGRTRLIIDGKPHLLRPGDACLIEPGERHQLFNETDEELVLLAITSPPWIAEDSVFGESRSIPDRR
jgi:mannose-6-phosphate isomerase-like protein (cupin superfamily)